MINQNYLEKFNKKIEMFIDKHSSFSDLYNYLSLDKIKLVTKYDYNEALSSANTLKEVINKILSIIHKPHISSITNEVILRSELSSSISTESFIKTSKDVKLWKRKNVNSKRSLTPEYVYSVENIDTIDIYENRFISLLIDEINKEIKELVLNLSPLIESLEDHYETNVLSFGKTSIMNDLENKGYPINGLFLKAKANKALAYKEIRKLEKKIKLIKDSEFYKITSKTKINKNILATNILLHDPLYNYCYKFYKEHYLSKEEINSSLNIYYYNYILINFFNHLTKLNIAKTSLSNKAKLYFDESHRLRFSDLSAKKDIFAFRFIEDPNELGFKIEIKLINKAIRTDTKVNKTNFNSTYLLISYKETDTSLIHSKEVLSKVDTNSKYLITQYALNGDYKDTILLSIYRDDNPLIIKNFLRSLVLLFDTDLDLFKSKCPICGKDEVIFDGFNYICKNCNSVFSINETIKGDVLWVKSLRRIY